MPTSVILVGLGMAAMGIGGRIVMRTAPKAISNMENVIKSMPSQLDSKAWANSKFYKGGFEPKMTKREVKQIFEEILNRFEYCHYANKCHKYIASD